MRTTYHPWVCPEVDRVHFSMNDYDETHSRPAINRTT